MNLGVPDFVEKVDLHEAIQLAPANDYIANPVVYTTVTDDLDPTRFENGGIIMSLEKYLSDGLHLTDASYKIMYELVMRCVQRRWPEITPGELSMPVQWWGDIVATAQQRDEL
jgi:lysophospholipase L1-like esterase